MKAFQLVLIKAVAHWMTTTVTLSAGGAQLTCTELCSQLLYGIAADCAERIGARSGYGDR